MTTRSPGSTPAPHPDSSRLDQKEQVDSSVRPRFQVVTSRGFVEWLAQENVGLAFTTYQRGGLIFLGRRPDGELGLWASSFDRAMGLCASGDGLWLGTAFLLWRLENSLAPGEVQDGFDRVYVPRRAYTTGDLDVHDLAVGPEDQPIFVNTRFNCLATVDPRCSFRPVWRPPFIGALVPEDRCHLNGLALEGGRPKFVTIVARTDVADGWRDHRERGGLVMDVTSDAVLAEGLSMPHSPRLHRGRLWLLEAGTGHLGYLDFRTGRFERVAFLPGYARGLTFVGNHAIVGLSRPRREHSFQGLPLDRNLAEKGAKARCALHVVELDSGVTVHWARIEEGIEELYDVVALPGVVRPKALSFVTAAIGHRFCFVEEGRWRHWAADPGSVEPPTGPAPTLPGTRPITPAHAESDPTSAEELLQRADGLAVHHRFDQAIEAYRNLLARHPDHVEALVGLATILARRDDLAGAIDLLRRALRLRPQAALICHQLAAVYELAGMDEEALAGYRRAVKLKPDLLRARHRLSQIRDQRCDWQGRTEEKQALAALLKDHLARGVPGLGNPVDPWSLLTLPLSPDELLPLARAFSSATTHTGSLRNSSLRTAFPPHSAPRPGRCRIGYLAHEFRHGALTQLMAGVFEAHDRQRFEIFGYADTPDDGSSRGRRVEEGCDHFRRLRALDVVEAARCIAADELDVLVVLNPLTTDARPEIAALRPAPIQVSYQLCVTSGADYFDYFLTDRTATPPGSEGHFSEHLVFLPPPYLVTDDRMPFPESLPSRAACGLPDQGFVFCCFNNPYKIDPPTFDLWMRLLAEVPGSILWVFGRYPEVRANLAREAAARGIAGDRLVSADKLPHEEHLARLPRADLILDTPLVNSITTAVDALWAGVPVLTLPGDHFAQRACASLVLAAGLPELIATDHEDYLRKAIHLARHTHELQALRDRLHAGRRTCPLFDTKRKVRQLEQAYEAMIERRRSGRPPGRIHLDGTEPCA